MSSQSLNSSASDSTGGKSEDQKTSGASQNQNSQPQSATGATSQENTSASTTQQTATVDLKPIQDAITNLTGLVERLQKETGKEFAKHRNRIKELAEGKKPDLSDEDSADGKPTPEQIQAQLAALQGERDQIKAQNDRINLERAIERAAFGKGFKFPEDVIKLVNVNGIKPDEKNPGKFTGIDEALTELENKYPYLKGGKVQEKPDTNSKTSQTEAETEKRTRNLSTRFGINSRS